MAGIYSGFNFWSNPNYGAQHYYMLAKACRFAAGNYDATELARFCDQIGATVSGVFALSGATPSYIHFSLAGSVELFCFYGMGSFEQMWNGVIFSGSVPNTSGPGLVSAIGDASFNAIKTSIVDAWNGTTGNPGKVIYAGYSLGGNVAALAAARARAQFPTSMTVYGLGLFGAPKVGNSAWQASLTGVNGGAVVRRGDPIPSLPPDGDGITLSDLLGGSTNARQRITEYVTVPNVYELTSNALVLSRTPLSLNAIDALRIGAGCALNGDLPEDHKIGNYVDDLQRAAEGELLSQMRAHNRQKEALIMQFMDEESEEPEAELVTPTAPTAWPDPIVREPLPTPPAGHTYTRQFTRVTAIPRNYTVSFRELSATEHEARHDGRAHKDAKRIAQDLATIRHHDWSVAQGGKGKRQILFDKNRMDDTIEQSFYNVEQYILNNV